MILAKTLDPMFRENKLEDLSQCGIVGVTATDRYSRRPAWNWTPDGFMEKNLNFDEVESSIVGQHPGGVLRFRANGQRHLYTFYFLELDPDTVVELLQATSVMIG